MLLAFIAFGTLFFFYERLIFSVFLFLIFFSSNDVVCCKVGGSGMWRGGYWDSQVAFFNSIYFLFLDFSFSFDLQRSNISRISMGVKGKATLKVREFSTLFFI